MEESTTSSMKYIAQRTKKVWREQLTLFKTKTNMDFKGSDTQYSTHAIHTYVAAMVPQLAERLVLEYVPRDELVLDPFCGGGAVLVECVRNGRRGVGSDINPLAVLISKVKSTYIEKKIIEEATQYVLNNSIRGLNGTISFPEKYNMEYWFHPHTIAELSSISRCIDLCDSKQLFPPKVIDVLKVVFSATIRDVMLTYRNEIRLRRLQSDDLRKFKPNSFKSFEQRSHLTIERISHLPNHADIQVACVDVRRLTYEDKYFHSIICSPPYGDEKNGVSYLQFSKFMLYWLGFSRENIIDTRKKTLGSFKGDIKLPSPTLHKAYSNIILVSDDESWLNFYRDYYAGLVQMARITRKNIIIVIGNRILKQTVIENGRITVELMDSLGFTLYKRFERVLPSKRLPKLRRENTHGFGGAIDKEDILIFRHR